MGHAGHRRINRGYVLDLVTVKNTLRDTQFLRRSDFGRRCGRTNDAADYAPGRSTRNATHNPTHDAGRRRRSFFFLDHFDDFGNFAGRAKLAVDDFADPLDVLNLRRSRRWRWWRWRWGHQETHQ